MRLLTIFFLSLLLVGCVDTTPIERKTVVLLLDKAGERNGSGVLIGESAILTAAHVAKIHPDLFLIRNGQTIELELVKKDEVIDLALFKTKQKVNCPCAKLGTNPPIDASVKTVGFPAYALYKNQVLTHGHVQGYSDTNLFSSASAAPGNSGGGVFYQGKLVAILVAGVSTGGGFFGASIVPHLTLTVNLATINQFLRNEPWVFQ